MNKQCKVTFGLKYTIIDIKANEVQIIYTDKNILI